MEKICISSSFCTGRGGRVSGIFPGFRGGYTCGDDLQDAIMMAEDVLAFYLYDEEKGGNVIPKPTPLKQIKLRGNEFANYIACDTREYAKLHNNRAVKKLSIYQNG